MDDDGHTRLLRLPDQGAEVGNELGLLGAADGQGHGDGVGAQADGILHRVHPDIVLGMVGRQGGAFHEQGNAARIGLEAALGDALHHDHRVRAGTGDAVHHSLDVLDTGSRHHSWARGRRQR